MWPIYTSSSIKLTTNISNDEEENKAVVVYEEEKRKPKAILDCYNNKDRIDTADEMLRSYSTKALSRRWL